MGDRDRVIGAGSRNRPRNGTRAAASPQRGVPAGLVGWLMALSLLIALLAPLIAPRGISAQDDGEAPIVSTEDESEARDTPASDWAPPTRVYVPETGQTIDGLFLDLWREGGGVWAFGNPITPEFTLPNGRIIQYYHYARFEYWPEGDADGNLVRLGDIGEELRPRTLRRTRLGFTGAIREHPAALAATVTIAKAWLPLPASEQGTDSATRRFIPETGHSIVGGFKDFWERTGEAAYLGNPLTEEYVLAGTTYQVFERGQLRWRPGTDPEMVPLGEVLAERYGLEQGAVEQGDVPAYSEDLFIPPPPPTPEPETDQDNDGISDVVEDENQNGIPDGEEVKEPDPNAERWIEVDLSDQYMWAWQGDVVVQESYVSTGREGFDTPTGTFFINSKIPVQDMEGVIGGEYYNVPQVPDVMYFTSVGHAFHGAYWHNNFGQVMSHGCVNLPMDVAAWLYEWTSMGARVEIHD